MLICSIIGSALHKSHNKRFIILHINKLHTPPTQFFFAYKPTWDELVCPIENFGIPCGKWLVPAEHLALRHRIEPVVEFDQEIIFGQHFLAFR